MVAFASLGCGRSSLDDPPPTLVRFEIVEGRASCEGCPLAGDRVVAAPDGSLTLRLGSTYTARAFVRTAGAPDRCIYRIFTYSWPLFHSREFQCTLEQVEMTLDQVIPTDAFSVGQTTNHRILATLSEYYFDARTSRSTQHLHDFPVRFAP